MTTPSHWPYQSGTPDCLCRCAGHTHFLEISARDMGKFRANGHPLIFDFSAGHEFLLRSPPPFQTVNMATNGLSASNKETVLAKQAKQASLIVGALSLNDRNAALQKIYDVLTEKQIEILEANKLDMQVNTPPLVKRQEKLRQTGSGGIGEAGRVTKIDGEEAGLGIAGKVREYVSRRRGHHDPP